MNFPKKTEVIVSAVNIPAMIQVLHAHSLKVVSLDIDIETMAPKLQFLESLINSNTKLLLLANVFGKGFDTEPYIQLAKRHNLAVIEDWAEGFSGFDYVGHPDADLALFSFGPIKYYTAFGGAVAKIRDEKVFQEMHRMYESYPLQSHAEYLTKVNLKYFKSVYFRFLKLQKNFVIRDVTFKAWIPICLGKSDNFTRDAVSVSTSRSRDGLETYRRSRSRLGHVGKRLGLVSVSGAKVSVLASVSTV